LGLSFLTPLLSPILDIGIDALIFGGLSSHPIAGLAKAGIVEVWITARATRIVAIVGTGH
jgi:hypothetical protein